jgi:hypothetical protein
MRETITRKPKSIKDILALYPKDSIDKRENGGYRIHIQKGELTINGDMMDTIKSCSSMTLEKNSGVGNKYHYKEVKPSGKGWFWRAEWLAPDDMFEKELFEI